jgi:maltooligosyltrehalose trehalohydrolase
VRRSALRWDEVSSPGHRELFDLYRALIALRRSRPELADPRLDRFAVREEGPVLVLHRGSLRVVCNLGEDAEVRLDVEAGEVLLASAEVKVDGQAVHLPADSFAVVDSLAVTSPEPGRASRPR